MINIDQTKPVPLPISPASHLLNRATEPLTAAGTSPGNTHSGLDAPKGLSMKVPVAVALSRPSLFSAISV